jgi:hypothetical protein
LQQLSRKEGRKALNSDHISMPTRFGSGAVVNPSTHFHSI